MEWSPPRVRAHMSYLDGPEVEGRQTATRGYTRAAAYVAGHLRDIGLQPILNREYRLQYAARIRRSVRAEFRTIDADTLNWRLGEKWILTDIPSAVRSSGTGLPLPDAPYFAWNPEAVEAVTDSTRWSMEIGMQEQVTSAPIHVVGMLPGADPRVRDSLMVVIAPLDGFGFQGDQSWTDGRDLSIPAAALLESSRRMAFMQERWSLYPQSILIMFASGTSDACQGLAAIQRHFPWDMNLVSRVTVVRMQADERCNWQEEFSQAPLEHARFSQLVAYSPFVEDGEYGFGAWRPRSEALGSGQVEGALVVAMRLAQEIMAHVQP